MMSSRRQILREDIREWIREHPVATGAAIVITASFLVYIYERLRWRAVRP